MIDIIVGAIIVAAVGLALAYIIRLRKNGVMCVGCPDAKYCCSRSHTKNTSPAGGCGTGCTGCTCHTDTR